MSISEFLEKRLPQARRYPPGRTVHINEDVRSGIFTLNDDIACDKCKNSACNKENLIINSGDALIHIIDFEKYVAQFAGTAAELTGGRCDYLLYDEDREETPSKIALCDLTCSETKHIEPNNGKYPEGKRAKAFNQMRNSLECLLESEQLLRLSILSKSIRQLIFGWRERGGDVADLAEANMLDFAMNPSLSEPLLRSQQYASKYRFEFIQVKYNENYIW